MRGRQTCVAVLVLLLGWAVIAQADVSDGLKGLWEFSNPDDLTAATVGKDLVLAGGGAQAATAGVIAGDGAVSIGVGSYYECTADIPANGGGGWVNEYTLLFDIKYPASSAGQWRCFLQTNTSNSNDGDYFIHPSDESWGVGAIGYTDNATVGEFYSSPDTWYRAVMSVDMGGTSPFFKLYINGTLVATHTSGLGLDGRHSLYTEPDVTLLLFADENGEDAEMHCSTAAIWERPLTDEEVALLGVPGAPVVKSGGASEPNPIDGATDVPRDVVLSWTAGEFAATHDVYLGTVFEDVNEASRANPMGVLVSQNQADASYDPDGLLDFSQTYYWRVDEVNAAPDLTIFRGDVWSFTTEPFTYPVQNILATSNTISPEGQGPENTVNGSGLDEADQHSTETDEMWVGSPVEGQTPYIQFEFDGVYKLYEMLVWNYNMNFETFLGMGVKETTIEYSENGADWTVLKDVVLNQAPGTPTYVANTQVAFDGVGAKYVRLTINSSYTSTAMHGLSEVRFMYTPVKAREPQPADGAVNVALQTTLKWRAGREAVSHEVYLGTDPDALLLATTTTAPSHAVTLDLGTTYFWQIVEVNDAETISAWPGDIWSFSTQEYLVLENFESYTDDYEAGEAIWQTWIDGWEDPTNGSQVGYGVSPFAEQTIVHGGGQSMPLSFNNPSASVTSEADRTLAPAQNWTGSGIKSLSLWFHGAQGNAGQLYVKINGTKIPYGGDASDIAKETWVPWNIDLTTAGVNVGNVTTLTVGVEGVGSGIVYIDDMRLYPTAGDLIEPIAPDDADASLLGLWKLDDGAGTVAADSSGNNPSGIFNGAPQWVAGGAAGGALQLDGVDDYVVLGSLEYGDAATADLSVALWVKTDGWNDDAAMISNKDWNSGGNTGWVIAGGAGDNGSFQWNFSDGQGRADFDPPVTLSRIAGGQWHHLCVTHDRDGLAKFYYDGLLIGDEDISALRGSLDSGLPTVLGTDGAEGAVWAYWFAGTFDDVRIYNRVLSHGEVAGLTGRTAPLYQGF